MATTDCPPDTHPRLNCEFLLQDPSAVLYVPDPAEHSGFWHLEDPKSVCGWHFTLPFIIFQISTKCQDLHRALEVQRWLIGDTYSSLVRENGYTL